MPSRIAYTNTVSIPRQGNTPIELTAVMVGPDACGQYGVYVGVGEAYWVMCHGAKQTFREARYFFPSLEERLYRR